MDTGQMIADRIEQLVQARGTNPRAVALAAGMSPTGVRDIITRKTKNPTFANLLKIAEVLDVDVSAIVGGAAPERPAVAVAGKVGAGAEVELYDSYAKGDGLYHVACPPQIGPRGIVAVEVEGNSMEPAYEAGDVLFYSREALGVPAEAVGRRCVVEDEDGMVWVKLLRRRDGQPEGLFDLISFHADTPPKYDVAVKWAAPIKMHLGRDLVTKV